MKVLSFKTIVIIISAVFLYGCANNSPYANQSNQIVSTPRVTGTTTPNGTRASSTVTIGNHQTPARVNVNVRTSPNGTQINPNIRSRYINWNLRTK